MAHATAVEPLRIHIKVTQPGIAPSYKHVVAIGGQLRAKSIDPRRAIVHPHIAHRPLARATGVQLLGVDITGIHIAAPVFPGHDGVARTVDSDARPKLMGRAAVGVHPHIARAPLLDATGIQPLCINIAIAIAGVLPSDDHVAAAVRRNRRCGVASAAAVRIHPHFVQPDAVAIGVHLLSIDIAFTGVISVVLPNDDGVALVIQHQRNHRCKRLGVQIGGVHPHIRIPQTHAVWCNLAQIHVGLAITFVGPGHKRIARAVHTQGGVKLRHRPLLRVYPHIISAPLLHASQIQALCIDIAAITMIIPHRHNVVPSGRYPRIVIVSAAAIGDQQIVCAPLLAAIRQQLLAIDIVVIIPEIAPANVGIASGVDRNMPFELVIF